MNQHPLNLTAADGHRITGTLFQPAAPVACLVISHGMAEHGNRYTALAQWLVAHDVAVISYHHRGHGPDCTDTDLGHYADRNGWAKVVSDLDQVVGHARDNFPELPLSLLGHSMGSFIAQSYAQQHGASIDALILSASNRLNRAELVPWRLLIGLIKRVRGQRHRSKLIAGLTFGKFNRMFRPNRTACDWLSRDEQQVDQYLADPICGFECSAGLWHDFLGGMLSINPKLWHKDLPIHLFSGSADPVGEMGKGIRQHFQTIREADIQKVTFRLFDGGRHEMLNELNAEDVWQHLMQCIPTVQPACAEPL
ncbi:alpha/beta fold hydrolase [Marinobacter sp.]|uniref:alpha/beta fold hydrolase n=1 Tax=Marinobacter sp. TaxID=50741 RepID=UPI002B267731|nr:alpha/beta fold hydrolase [Marinobacter sp.]